MRCEHTLRHPIVSFLKTSRQTVLPRSSFLGLLACSHGEQGLALPLPVWGHGTDQDRGLVEGATRVPGSSPAQSPSGHLGASWPLLENPRLSKVGPGSYPWAPVSPCARIILLWLMVGREEISQTPGAGWGHWIGDKLRQWQDLSWAHSLTVLYARLRLGVRCWGSCLAEDGRDTIKQGGRWPSDEGA